MGREKTAAVDKPEISLLICGHVDSGKSTTTGHLLVQCGAIGKNEVASTDTQARTSGKEDMRFAWLTDKLEVERERGVTVSLTANALKLPSGKNCMLIDAPGHRDFIGMTLSGVSQADATVLVVSAAEGEFEAGFAKEGQTREHSALSFFLGVKQLVVAVNKMDDHSVGYSQARYEQIKTDLGAYLKKVGFGVDKVEFVPTSSLLGDNLVSASTTMGWYQGPTLAQAIEKFTVAERPTAKPLRIPILDIYQVADVGTIVAGRIEAGTVKVGQTVVIAPSMITGKVDTIEMQQTSIKEASCGDMVGLKLNDLSSHAIERGMVLGDAKTEPPADVESFVAQLMILNPAGEIKRGYTPIMDCHTLHFACKMSELQYKIDKKTGKPSVQNPLQLNAGDAAMVTMVPTKAVCLETSASFAELGRFTLRDHRQTIGFGVIKSVKTKGGAAPAKEK